MPSAPGRSLPPGVGGRQAHYVGVGVDALWSIGKQTGLHSFPCTQKLPPDYDDVVQLIKTWKTKHESLKKNRYHACLGLNNLEINFDKPLNLNTMMAK